MMLKPMPEINPTELLYNPYQPIEKEDLAILLGVTDHAIESWCKQKRKPSKPARILAALLLEKWRSQASQK
ncbi:MAG: hypothetical protein WBA93_17320 [Microcoleaceae cyanobacterium]